MTALYCRNCRFWDLETYNMEVGQDEEDNDDPFQAYCRRFPPPSCIHPEDEHSFLGWPFPVTPRHHWCGEFQVKESPDEQCE